MRDCRKYAINCEPPWKSNGQLTGNATECSVYRIPNELLLSPRFLKNIRNVVRYPKNSCKNRS